MFVLFQFIQAAAFYMKVCRHCTTRPPEWGWGNPPYSTACMHTNAQCLQLHFEALPLRSKSSIRPDFSSATLVQQLQLRSPNPRSRKMSIAASSSCDAKTSSCDQASCNASTLNESISIVHPVSCIGYHCANGS